MSPPTILVVDDEQSITGALAVLFQQTGYHTLVARSGAKALDKLSQQPDLIVLDIMMPGLDGYEVTRRVRQRQRYVPIVMLTAKDQSWEKVAGLERGADAYLTRPFAPDELLAQARALGRQALLRHVWGYDQPVDSRTVDTHIRRLRAKIEPHPAQPQLLQTIRGFGYRLTPL